jgi:riboflavin synthase
MFSGIVQNRASVTIEARLPQLRTLSVPLSAKQRESLAVGASIALNGACLTVTRMDGDRAFFDVMMETLRVTNLADLSDGDIVNVERAARFGDDIGGHVMSGHVHHRIPIVAIERPENNCVIWFGINDEQRRYLFPKGYVGLNGCSLTIGEVREDRFNVFLIPETLTVTTFGKAETNDLVNVEFDAHTQAIVDTLGRMKEAGQL